MVIPDTSRFPEMSAAFYLFDANGELVTDLEPSDILVQEDGVPRTVTGIECSEPESPRRLSTVVTIDMSGSMDEYTPRIVMAKAAATDFVNRYALGRSECAVTTFDDHAYLNQDFTTRKDWILDAVAEAGIYGGTDYNAALFNEPASALNVAKAGKYKRVVLLLSDGALEGNLQSIVDAANSIDASIYCVSFEGFASPIMYQMAWQTGGLCFDVDEGEMDEAYWVIRAILDHAQGGSPCRLTWRSDNSCWADRKVTFTVPKYQAATTMGYTVPETFVTRIDLLPGGYAFETVPPGESREVEVKLTVRNVPLTILNLRSDDARFELVDGGPSLPRTVGKDESLAFKVRFTPSDSNIIYGRIIISSDLCADRSFYMSGGSYHFPIVRPTLKILAPNGGERFAAGDTAVVRWEGVLASDSITLDYSLDSGITWQNITTSATGLEYPWVLPATPSEHCILSARQFPGGSRATVVKNLLAEQSARITAARYRADGRLIIGGGTWGAINVWDVETGEILHKFKSDVGINDVDYNSDGGRVVAAFGEIFSGGGSNVARIFDSETGAVLQTFRGHTDQVLSSMFNRDGTRLLTLGNGEAWVWDANTGDTIYTLRPDSVINSVRYSPDYRHILTVGGGIRLWDAETGAFIREIAPGISGLSAYSYDGNWIAAGDPQRIIDVATGAERARIIDKRYPYYSNSNRAFSHDGLLLATSTPSSDKEFAQVWDATNGMYMGVCAGESWGNTMRVEFSPDDKFLMTARADTVKLWKVNFRVVQSDRSDSLWAIAGLNTSGLDVDMGTVMVSQQKDSLVRSCVVNGSSMPITVRSVSIRGAWAGAFSVIAGRGPFTLLPGESRGIEFRFAPAGTGRYTASIEIITQGDTVIRTITGQGVEQRLAIEPAVLDFGEQPVGATKNMVTYLKNVGTGPIVINGIGFDNGDDPQFEIAPSSLPIRLQPGERQLLGVRFNARRIGRTEARVMVDQDITSVPFRLRLLASAYGESLVLPDTSAAPGERIVLPVLLRTPGRFEESIPYRRYRFQLRYDAAVLYPVSGIAGPPAREGVYGMVTVEGTWDGSDTLARPGFVAALGTPQTFDLDLLSFTWLDDTGNPVDRYVDVLQGAFHLADLCVVGGERMILTGEQAALKPAQPNPASGVVSIPYQVAEHGRTRLILHDMLGRMVLVLVDDDRAPGAYVSVFDVSSLAAGTYLCTLQTPTERFSQVLQVMR